MYFFVKWWCLKFSFLPSAAATATGFSDPSERREAFSADQSLIPSSSSSASKRMGWG